MRPWPKMLYLDSYVLNNYLCVLYLPLFYITKTVYSISCLCTNWMCNICLKHSNLVPIRDSEAALNGPENNQLVYAKAGDAMITMLVDQGVAFNDSTLCSMGLRMSATTSCLHSL